MVSPPGQFAGSAIGEFNGFFLPPNFDRYAPGAQERLIDALQERWRTNGKAPPPTEPDAPATGGAAGEQKSGPGGTPS